MYVISNHVHCARKTLVFARRIENINKQANYLSNNLPLHSCAMVTRGLTCSDLPLTGMVTKGRDKSQARTQADTQTWSHINERTQTQDIS